MTWLPLDPSRADSLASSRTILHHAMQLVSGFGLAYAPFCDDDSHSALRWSERQGALLSPFVLTSDGLVALGLRLTDLTLFLSAQDRSVRELPLAGATIPLARSAVQDWMSLVGLDGGRYTLRRHFEIPYHAIADGAPIPQLPESDLAQWHAWIANTAGVLGDIVRRYDGGAVYLWPHHADIATLVTLTAGRTTGAGVAMGDASYAEPYFYVNAYPPPALEPLTAPLEGGGHWHRDGWVGAVLPGSRLANGSDEQRAQVLDFFASALAVTTKVATP